MRGTGLAGRRTVYHPRRSSPLPGLFYWRGGLALDFWRFGDAGGGGGDLAAGAEPAIVSAGAASAGRRAARQQPETRLLVDGNALRACLPSTPAPWRAGDIIGNATTAGFAETRSEEKAKCGELLTRAAAATDPRRGDAAGGNARYALQISFQAFRLGEDRRFRQPTSGAEPVVI